MDQVWNYLQCVSFLGVSATAWLISFAALYVLASIYYLWRAYRAKREIFLAPITVRGTFEKSMSSATAGQIIQAQLASATTTFVRASEGHASAWAAESVDVTFPTFNTALLGPAWNHAAPKSPVEFNDKELVLSVGTTKIPVGAIVRRLFFYLRYVPVPGRKAYLRAVIHVSLIVEDKRALVVVSRGSTKRGDAQQRPSSLVATAEINHLFDLNDLLRSAAFMICDLHGDFEGFNGLGMKHLADALNAVDEYRQHADPETLKRAEKSFLDAVAADPNNYLAHYFYASRLLVTRKRGDIALAEKLYERALDTLEAARPPDGPKLVSWLKLNAMVNAGLAQCYVQRVHRLAAKAEVAKDAKQRAKYARQLWEEALDWERRCSEEALPSTENQLILVTEAVTTISGHEGARKKSVADRKAGEEAFEEAVEILGRAIELDPANSWYWNVQGYMLFRLAELLELDNDCGDKAVFERYHDTCENARLSLRRAVETSFNSKMSHANLCCVLSLRLYREDIGEARKRNLLRCRYHGIRATQIDPEYINGFRDLAVALARYGEYEEAHWHYLKALKLAGVLDKDLEIVDDAVDALRCVGAPDEVIDEWRNVPPELLEPHDEKPGRSQKETSQAEASKGEALAEKEAADTAQPTDRGLLEPSETRWCAQAPCGGRARVLQTRVELSRGGGEAM